MILFILLSLSFSIRLYNLGIFSFSFDSLNMSKACIKKPDMTTVNRMSAIIR